MLRFVPLGLIVVALAGCGSSKSSPSSTAPPASTSVSRIPASKIVVFGHGAQGNHIIGKPTNGFPVPAQVAWVGHLAASPGSDPLYLTIQKVTSKGTTTVVQKQIPTPAGSYVTGKLTPAQIKQYHVETNNLYNVIYATKNGGDYLAVGNFTFGHPTNTGTTPGY